jgi:hypothetical protein
MRTPGESPACASFPGGSLDPGSADEAEDSMAGPVWRHEPSSSGTCEACLREVTGLFVEGEVDGNALHPGRKVCADCYGRSHELIVGGELGSHVTAPAYARRP